MNQFNDEFIKNAIEEAIENNSKIEERVLTIGGFTSNRIRHLLNNLCSIDNVSYLEIGVLKGATLISASYKNTGTFIGIDDCSECGASCEEITENLDNFKDVCKTKFISGDCFDSKTTRKIRNNSVDILFYDGNHSYEAQKNALVEFYRKMKNKFILVVDDWNWKNSRNGTFDAIEELRLKELYMQELFTSNNENGRADDWWNGIGFFLLEK